MWLPLLCEKSGVIALVLPGLMVGWQADEIALNLKKLKLYTGWNIQVFAIFNKGTVLL